MASDLAAVAVPTPRARGRRGRPDSAVLRVAFPCTGPDLRAALACEAVVFGRRYGNTAEQLEAEYGPYRDGSRFGAVLAPDGRALGAVRLLSGGPAGLKTLTDAAAPPWDVCVDAACAEAGLDPAATWDVATFAVDPDTHTGTGTVNGTGSSTGGSVGARPVTLALFAVMFGAFRDNGVSGFVAVLDAAARRPISAVGVLTDDLPGATPAPYLGSPASVPVYARVPDLHRRHAREFPALHRQVFHGQGIGGLDPAAALPGAFRLPPAGPSAAPGVARVRR